jgi:hypothetical protein
MYKRKSVVRYTLRATRNFVFTTIACLWCDNAIAQFNLSAEIRPRAEYRHGFKKLYGINDDPAFFVEQRSRLNASYQSEKYKIGLVLQDIRIWGETAQINKTDGLTSVHEAWAEILFTRKFSVKAGRQELVYDDHRILGNLDWAAQARSHDALVFKFVDSTFTLHAGFAFNQNSDVPEPIKLTSNFYSMPGGFTTSGGGLPNYKNMQYGWFQKLFGKNQLTGLILNTGWQMPDTTVNYLVTAGLNSSITVSKTIRFIGSFYYQAGRDRADKKVDAYLLSAALQYNGFPKAPVTLGVDVVTGTRPGEQDSNTFDPLFGTHHAFYGHMDYFYVGSPHTQQGATVGLVDIFAKTTFQAGKKTSVILHAHEFLSHVSIIDPENSAKNLSSALGAEVDAIFNFEYDKAVNLKVGYSQLFATRSMEAIKGGDKDKLQQWTWLMLTVKPSLLSFPMNK